MGVAHALAVLHALMQASPATRAKTGATSSLSTTLPLPFPHVQQRLQQTLPGVVLVVALGVVVPYGAATLLPLQRLFEFPGVFSFGFLATTLALVSLVHVLLRYVMVPGSSSSSSVLGGGKSNSSVYGWLQTSICVAVELLARVRQEPQLLVLATLSLVHAWLTKQLALGFVSDAAADQIAAQFSSFVLVSGIVSFVSFITLERRMGEDPFVLDRRSILETVVVRDVVRALRRGVVVYLLTRALLFVSRGDDVNVLTFRYYRAVFHITSSVIDSFVLLAGASIFRVLLFRPNISALADAVDSGSVWDSLAAPRPESQALSDLLVGGALAVSSQNPTPLADQYVVALKSRMDDAMKLVSTGKAGVVDATFEQVEAMEAQFRFTNLLLATKFDAHARRALFASETRWNGFVRASTSVVDCFTLMLQLLNTVPERKNAGQEGEAAAVEKSVSTLVSLVLSKQDQHPLFVLDAHPHLSNLRISSNGFKSKVHYYFASRVQFALRRFIVEEARRRVFVHVKAVHSAVQVLSHLVATTRHEDIQGNVQHTVPAVLTSLVECRNALETYIDTSAKIGNAGDVFENDAKALARGIDRGIHRITDAFFSELSSFTFAPGVKQTLESYTSCS